jgi:hypothetical protein
MSRARAIYRPLTAAEKESALALGRCSFPVASFSKRFARDLVAQVESRGEITDRQASRLAIQAYIYRRQMPAHLVPASPPPGYETPKQRMLRASAARSGARGPP